MKEGIVVFVLSKILVWVVVFVFCVVFWVGLLTLLQVVRVLLEAPTPGV